jgi:hypothetical protein
VYRIIKFLFKINGYYYAKRCKRYFKVLKYVADTYYVKYYHENGNEYKGTLNKDCLQIDDIYLLNDKEILKIKLRGILNG